MTYWYWHICVELCPVFVLDCSSSNSSLCGEYLWCLKYKPDADQSPNRGLHWHIMASCPWSRTLLMVSILGYSGHTSEQWTDTLNCLSSARCPQTFVDLSLYEMINIILITTLLEILSSLPLCSYQGLAKEVVSWWSVFVLESYQVWRNNSCNDYMFSLTKDR